MLKNVFFKKQKKHILKLVAKFLIWENWQNNFLVGLKSWGALKFKLQKENILLKFFVIPIWCIELLAKVCASWATEI